MQVQLVERVFRRAERKRDTEFADKVKAIKEKMLLLSQIGPIILNEAGVPFEKVRPEIFQPVSKQKLSQAIAETASLVQPSDFNALSYATRSYAHLR
jgi:hypothetical protein